MQQTNLLQLRRCVIHDFRSKEVRGPFAILTLPNPVLEKYTLPLCSEKTTNYKEKKLPLTQLLKIVGMGKQRGSVGRDPPSVQGVLAKEFTFQCSEEQVCVWVYGGRRPCIGQKGSLLIAVQAKTEKPICVYGLLEQLDSPCSSSEVSGTVAKFARVGYEN